LIESAVEKIEKICPGSVLPLTYPNCSNLVSNPDLLWLTASHKTNELVVNLCQICIQKACKMEFVAQISCPKLSVVFFSCWQKMLALLSLLFENLLYHKSIISAILAAPVGDIKYAWEHLSSYHGDAVLTWYTLFIYIIPFSKFLEVSILFFLISLLSLAYFPWRKKSKLVRSPCCLYMGFPFPTCEPFDCHEIWYELYATRCHPNLVHFNILHWIIQHVGSTDIWGGSVSSYWGMKLCMVISLQRLCCFCLFCLIECERVHEVCI